MNSEKRERTLRDYLAILRQRRLIVVAAVLAALAAAVAHIVLAEPRYVADASLSFKDQGEDLGLLGTPSPEDPQPEKTAAASARRIVQPDVARAVAKKVDGGESAAALQDEVATRVDPTSNLVLIEATASSGELAAAIANGFAREAQRVLTEEQREVVAALRTLPRRQREVLVLRYWSELSEAEIADALGVAKGTVKSSASRGLAALQKHLGDRRDR